MYCRNTCAQPTSLNPTLEGNNINQTNRTYNVHNLCNGDGHKKVKVKDTWMSIIENGTVGSHTHVCSYVHNYVYYICLCVHKYIYMYV